MDTKLIVSASPHLRSEETTAGLMANVIVALTPCVVASAIIFGLRALLVTAVSVVACVAFEWLYCKLMKKANPISDLSAVVTGIILAMNVPVGLPKYSFSACCPMRATSAGLSAQPDMCLWACPSVSCSSATSWPSSWSSSCSAASA